MLNILKGWLGEKVTAFSLWSHLDDSVYHRVHDLIVPSPNGTTQVDHVIVSRFGIFVVETKNYDGWIFGSEKDATWCQVLFGKKSKFQNPLRQNHKHIKHLESFLDIEFSCFHSLVVFVGDCEFKTDFPSNVLHSGLGSYITSFTKVIFSENEVRVLHGK
jgi:restriction system protein